MQVVAVDGEGEVLALVVGGEGAGERGIAAAEVCDGAGGGFAAGEAGDVGRVLGGAGEEGLDEGGDGVGGPGVG